MCPSSDHGGVPAKSAESHVLSFIWYAVNKSSMRNVASRCDLAESSVHRMLQRVPDFIIEMGPTVLTLPDDMDKMSRDFEKVSGVPGVVGCIDGSYIKIQCTKKVAATYCNRHHYLSITLQAVCDKRRRFVDVLVGSSSRTHGARVFRQSSLATKLPGLCQGDKYHLLGDAANPLRQYLLTNYRDYRNLSKAQREFNKKFSATPVLIENAFSTLKKRFRQPMYLELHTVDWLIKFILACCVLHNLCIDAGDTVPDETEDTEVPGDTRNSMRSDGEANLTLSSEEAALRRLGEIKRFWVDASRWSEIDFLNIPHDSEVGYVYVVDYSYPEELHALTRDFPLAPEHRQEKHGSSWQCGSGMGVRKELPFCHHAGAVTCAMTALR
ncbi:putative nuclease HARBI1 [Ornithodoros turicata]|uniref:putative nuclease HARBI1 n=1 Tax=Ornithodoros turicata TaxID=34597 RepID=UPI00313977A8